VPKNQSFSIQTIVNQFGVEKTIKIKWGHTNEEAVPTTKSFDPFRCKTEEQLL
jgi:hypothetical protein